MAWYGRRRSGEQRSGATAVVFGLGFAMFGVLAIQTSSAVRSGIAASRQSMDGATASVAGFASGIAGWSIGFGPDAKSRGEIDALRAEVLRLKYWEELAHSMELRMNRYEELLALRTEKPDLGKVARVIAETDGPFAATRIANAGSAEGVQEGWAAINDKGLVGRVIRVGPHTSRILLLSDYNSRLPVMGAQSQDRAMLVGNRGQGARIENAETPGKIAAGETWYTSGDDGQLPPGIKVGAARLDKDGTWRIDLAMMEGHVDFVRLVPPPLIPKPDDAPLPPPPVAGAKLTGQPQAASARPAATPAARDASPTPTASASPASPPGQGGRQ
jgi:rod shape-determining protein MreC